MSPETWRSFREAAEACRVSETEIFRLAWEGAVRARVWQGQEQVELESLDRSLILREYTSQTSLRRDIVSHGHDLTAHSRDLIGKSTALLGRAQAMVERNHGYF